MDASNKYIKDLDRDTDEPHCHIVNQIINLPDLDPSMEIEEP